MNTSTTRRRFDLTRPPALGRVRAVPVPSTPLLARALPRVDWSDAYALALPRGSSADPPDWADLIFHSPPAWVRGLFAAREALARTVGIERVGAHVFEAVAWRPGEVLLGTDQEHLAFRASVLLEADRLVLSTVVQVRNRRGRAYSALIRRVHPLVVRSMLAQAGRRAPLRTGRHVLPVIPSSPTTSTQQEEKT
jgi:hypothetical protein